MVGNSLQCSLFIYYLTICLYFWPCGIPDPRGKQQTTKRLQHHLPFGSPRENTFATWFFSTMATFHCNKEASANSDKQGEVISTIEAVAGGTLHNQLDLAILEILDDVALQTSDTQENIYGQKKCSKTPSHSVSMCPKPKGEVSSPMKLAPRKRSSQMEPPPATKKRRIARTNLHKKTHTEEKQSEEKEKLSFGLYNPCIREDQELERSEQRKYLKLFICRQCFHTFFTKEEMQMHTALHAAEKNSTRIKAPQSYC